MATYTLEVNKIKKAVDMKTGEATTYLAGAKFALFRDNLKIGEYVSNENGKIQINNLGIYSEKKNVIANYELKEIVAPNGYSAGRSIKFKVTEEKGVLKFVEELAKGQKATKHKVEKNKIIVTVENDVSFKLIKKDGETEQVLANCKFALYKKDSIETPATDSKGKIIGEKVKIGDKEYYAITTDSNGEIELDLPKGSYKLVEIQASAEYYDITNCVYEFEIKEDKVEAKIEEIEILDITGESNYDEISSIVKTSDGGYIIGGSFRSSQIKFGNKILTNVGTTSYADVMIVKYNGLGQVEWANSIGGAGTEKINSIIETSDGGCIAVGTFNSGTINVGEKTLKNLGSSGYYDGMIIKYNYSGNVEWAKAIGSSSTEEFTSVTETKDGGCLTVGTFSSNSIQIEDCKIVNNGSSDIMIIKQDRKGEIVWAKSFGGGSSDKINSIIETKDGGYLLAGEFNSSSIKIGQNTLNNSTSTSYADAILIKFNESDEVEWAKSFGGNYSDRIFKVIQTKDGEYLLVGEFCSTNIQLGNVALTNSGYSNSAEGMIIKCNSKGEPKLAKSVGGNSSDRINTVIETLDGGYLAAGEFFSSSIKVGNETLKNAGSTSYADGMLIKYNSNGEVEWSKVLGGNSTQQIKTIAEISNGHYVLGGNFYNTAINIDDKVLTNEGYSNAIKIKINQIYNTQEQTKLEVINNIKQFKITTDVKEINKVKGGTITGEDENPYESVKYDGTSQKEIKIIPNINYKIDKIVVNGVNYKYEVAEDGSYTMPQFKNMLENKHIEVSFKPIYEKVTVKIQYVDVDTKEIITYVTSSGETKNYNYEISGNVGERYTTEEKEIPYYEPVKELNKINRSREFTNGNVTLIYYYSKTPFNMSIDKEIEKIMVNGKIKNINNKKLFKLEVKESEVSKTEIIAIYKITVKNTGKIAGKAKVIETIPEGLIISDNIPEYWNKVDSNKLETIIELEPNESKELELTLTWKNLSDNFGLVKNTAEIVETSNEVNYQETTKEDNTSYAEMVISIKTGTEKINMKIISIILAVLLFTIALKISLKDNKELKKE